MEDAQKFAYETENGTFLTFVVGERKEADKYGKTHSCFVLVGEEDATPEVPEMAEATVVAEPEPTKGKDKRKKATA